ncbi:MAG: hypothetical protein NWR72_16155 [Bacteroidia bacterium]|nr:hypothetical protein [Bacteroidia bacterium]
MNRTFSLFATLGLLALSLTGCFEDKCEQLMTYYSYNPVYLSMEEIRAGVQTGPAQALKQPGKMYYKDGFLFISEVNKGIHVIDNTDPVNPTPVSFISVPGNLDIAAKGNILYADSYLDLVVIDISNPSAAAEVGREQNVFPYGSWHNGLWADSDSGIAIDWVETEITEAMDCSNVGGSWSFGRNTFASQDLMLVSAAPNASNSQFQSGTTNSAAAAGVGGSMARFTILNNYLYTVTFSDMIIFDLATMTDPVERNRINVGWDIETIFPRGNTLFLGGMTGMHIYSVDNPIAPEFLSNIQHVQSCDPVVADEEYAYVTIRDGNDCGGSVNQLFIVDLKDLRNPVQIYTYNFFNPHGLGISGETLFICDGDEGLKVYDATDVSSITAHQIAHFPNIHAFDVIPLGNVLLSIGEDGFYQYDYRDLTDIKLLSKIEVTP